MEFQMVVMYVTIAVVLVFYFSVYKFLSWLTTSSNQEGVSSTCWTKKKKISRALRAKPGTARYNIVQSRIMFI